MAIQADRLKEAKSALKSMAKKGDRKISKADFVASLIKEIHEKMEAGFSLAEICEELNKTLPEDEQIQLNTFKTYVRTARLEAGMKPLRSWTRRTEKPAKAEKVDQEVQRKEEVKDDIKSDFRVQDGPV